MTLNNHTSEVAVVSALLVSLLLIACSHGAAKINCEAPRHDFGARAAGSVIEHSFRISNTGDEPLQIRRVHAACGCTVAELQTDTIQPGSDTLIHAKLTLPTGIGPQDKTITVESNDPVSPTLVLHLKGKVTEGVKLRPESAMFGRVTTTSSPTLILEVISHGEKSKVKTVSSDHPNIRAEMDKDGRVQVTLKAPLLPGQLEGAVKIEFTDASTQPISAMVGAYVVGELGVSPQELLVASDPGQQLTRYITVSPGSVQQFRILKVETPAPTITSKVIEAAEGSFRIRVRGPLASAEAAGKAVRIYTDAPGGELLEIPIRILSPSKGPAEPANSDDSK
jgi:hypothetical protein